MIFNGNFGINLVFYSLTFLYFSYFSLLDTHFNDGKPVLFLVMIFLSTLIVFLESKAQAIIAHYLATNNNVLEFPGRDTGWTYVFR